MAMPAFTPTIRPYEPRDAEATRELCLAAIAQMGAQSYQPRQVRAWANSIAHNPSWHEQRSQVTTWVAEVPNSDGQSVASKSLAGFVGLAANGYIDMLYVSPEYASRGVATALLAHLVKYAQNQRLDHLWTYASVGAVPTFHHAGFTITKQCHPVRDGVELTNFLMEWSATATTAMPHS